jgi:hypothetical protein
MSIKLLLVDGSDVMRSAIRQLLKKELGIEVIGTATRALGQNEPLFRADSRDKTVLPQCEHSGNRELLQERLKTAC